MTAVRGAPEVGAVADEPLETDVFTPEEFAELFREPDEPVVRRVPRWSRAVAVFVALAMVAGTAGFLIDQLLNQAQLQEPAEIRAHAIERVAESEFGWLVTDIVVVPIDGPRIGGRVRNNPPDGIIEIDLRPWSRNRLDRLIDHEIGHLLDFTAWERGDSDRRGGLEVEAWAECAAVDAGTRRVDGDRADERYHCRTDELEIYQATVATLGEVCRVWGEPECRPVRTDAA